jgi:hypothetical protein
MVEGLIAAMPLLLFPAASRRSRWQRPDVSRNPDANSAM